MTELTRGIDISSHNGTVDFKKVKEAGYSYVIVRAGWSWYEGGMNIDKNFLENMRGAKEAGLHTGVYLYGYDKSPAAAVIAANALADLLQKNGYQLEYPVYYDQEETSLITLGKKNLTAIAKAFLDQLQKRGYYAAYYSYTSWMQSYVDMTQLAQYDVWVAQYSGKCTYTGKYGMWQHTVVGSVGKLGKDYYTQGGVPGVTSNCDLNICYKDYPAIMKRVGLNGFSIGEADAPNWQGKYESLHNALQELVRAL